MRMGIISGSQFYHDVVIIGGGLAGLSLAARLHDSGVRDICILERESCLGGNSRCAQQRWRGQNANGSESMRDHVLGLAHEVMRKRISVYFDATALRILRSKTVLAQSVRHPSMRVRFRFAVICAGAREITRGEMGIPGSRPSGVVSAGMMQRLALEDSLDVGKRSVIIGSNRLAFSVARMLLERGEVVERMIENSDCIRHPLGTDEDERCLDPGKIMLRTECVQIIGSERVEAVRCETRREDGGIVGETINCDNVIISAGFVPESEFAARSRIGISAQTGGIATDPGFRTSVKDVFALGDVVKIHDEAESIEREAFVLAEAIRASFAKGRF